MSMSSTERSHKHRDALATRGLTTRGTPRRIPKVKPPKTIHKFYNDKAFSSITACGLSIYGKDGSKSTGLDVRADARKATCGNCQRVQTRKVEK